MPALKRLISIILPILLALAVAYGAYVYLLQTASLSSAYRLAAVISIWVVMSIYLRRRWSNLKPLTSPPGLAGLVSAVLLANLAIAAVLPRIPYTQQFLPVRTISIQPLTENKPLTIQSFSTELAQWISLDNFQSSRGWRQEKGKLVHTGGAGSRLVWQGKPGQYVEIELQNCPDCGSLSISFDSQHIEQVDLNQASTERTRTVRYQYPSLFWHKALNFLALQAAIFTLAALLLDAFKTLFSRLRIKEPAGRQTQRLSGLAPPAIITFLSIIVYGLRLQPILFNDDWCQIVSWINFDTIAPFMIGERRPLNMFLPWLLDRFLPLEGTISALYLSTVGILTITALLVYVLVLQITPGKRWFALLAALLWLVFPSDYTRLYITMVGIRTAYLLIILVMILTARYIRLGSIAAISIASALLLVSLFLYEGQLGLALAWPVLCLYLYRPQPYRQRMPGLLVYAAAIGIFLFWRFSLQPGIYADAKLESITLAPWVILGRYAQGLPILLGGYKFPFPGYRWVGTAQVAVLSLAAVCSGLALLWVHRFWNADPGTGRDNGADAGAGTGDAGDFLLPYRNILLAGAVLWLAGYFPIILNFPPNIYGHLSRVNIFSILGAVLVLLGLVFIVMETVTTSRFAAAVTGSLLVVPLLVLGAAIQVQVQDSNIIAWNEAKAFYRQLVEVVPDIAPGSQIVVLLEGTSPTGEMHRPVFSASWEAACAVQTLYDQPDLRVMYRYDSIQVPPFPSNNVLAGAMETDTTGALDGQTNLLVLEYDRAARILDLRRETTGVLPEGSAGVYAPEQRILPLLREIHSRKLID